MLKSYEPDQNLKIHYSQHIVHEIKLRGKAIDIHTDDFYKIPLNAGKPLPYKFPISPPPGVTWKQVYLGEILNYREEQSWTSAEHENNIHAQNFHRMAYGGKPNVTLEGAKASSRMLRQLDEYGDAVVLPLQERVRWQALAR